MLDIASSDESGDEGAARSDRRQPSTVARSAPISEQSLSQRPENGSAVGVAPRSGPNQVHEAGSAMAAASCQRRPRLVPLSMLNLAPMPPSLAISSSPSESDEESHGQPTPTGALRNENREGGDDTGRPLPVPSSNNGEVVHARALSIASVSENQMRRMIELLTRMQHVSQRAAQLRISLAASHDGPRAGSSRISSGHPEPSLHGAAASSVLRPTSEEQQDGARGRAPDMYASDADEEPDSPPMPRIRSVVGKIKRAEPSPNVDSGTPSVVPGPEIAVISVGQPITVETVESDGSDVEVIDVDAAPQPKPVVIDLVDDDETPGVHISSGCDVKPATSVHAVVGRLENDAMDDDEVTQVPVNLDEPGPSRPRARKPYSSRSKKAGSSVSNSVNLSK